MYDKVDIKYSINVHCMDIHISAENNNLDISKITFYLIVSLTKYEQHDISID